MELLQQTQTARMVLAYLYDQQLESLAQQFCRKCTYLEEERRLLEIGDIPVRPFYRPLVQIFSEFNRMYMQSLTLISQYENQVTFPNALSELDKVDMIIELNRTCGISCLQNITNLGAAQVHKKSNTVASYPKQVATKPSAGTTIFVRQSTSENVVRESNGPPPIVSGANMHQSLPRKEICTAPEQTVSLNQEDIMTLLKCDDRGKENDDALSYLLHQGLDGQNTCSIVPASTNNQPVQEVAPMPHQEPLVPTTQLPPLQLQQANNSHSAEVSSVFAVPSTDHVQQRPVTEQVRHPNGSEEHVSEKPPNNADNSIIPPLPPPVVCSTVGIDVLTKEDGPTGMKEIVAARILGSMAKSGFGRSEPANDTPPGNPIVNNSVGGTRSSSSRKRSHIRILDFGTPAPKRPGSVPSSVENTRAREAGTGSHTRRLFPGQGTPAYGDGNASSSDAPTIPAGAQILSVANAERNTTSHQQLQTVHVISHDQQSSRNEPQHESQTHVHQPPVSVTSTVASVETVVTSTDTAASISQPGDDVQKNKNVLTTPPTDFRLPSAPKRAAQLEKSTIPEDAGEPPQTQKRALPRAIAATAEKKPRPLERTHSGTSWPSSASTSFSKPMEAVGEKDKKTAQDHALDDKKKKATPLKRQHSFSSRMATRSSTKLTASARVRSEVTGLISKLPTKESVLLKSGTKQQQQEATAGTGGLRSHSSTANELLYALNVEHTETPYKIDPLAEFPMTPRFLSDPMLSISKLDSSTFSGAFFRGVGSGVMSETADIDTPGFPITPGTLSTPQSQPSPAQNVVSYYRPDEGDVMQPPDELLQPVAASTDQLPNPRSRAPSECASEEGSDKMEIVAGDSVFVISSSPLIEMYEQKPSQC